MGIPTNKLEEIFESFKQVNYNVAKYGGTGLGLTISKGIVTLLNGTIQVDSQLDKGTTFSFQLPLEPLSNNREQLSQIDNSIKKEVLLKEKKYR